MVLGARTQKSEGGGRHNFGARPPKAKGGGVKKNPAPFSVDEKKMKAEKKREGKTTQQFSSLDSPSLNKKYTSCRRKSQVDR